MESWENYKRWYESYLTSLDGLRVKLTQFRPSQQGRREGLQERLDAVEPAIRALTLAEFSRDVLRPPPGSALGLYKDVAAKIRDAADPRVEIEDCQEGVLYRVLCRNSNCGIWVQAEKGFEIARTKFDNDYLFVEYHWNNGPPYGTARPYEILEELPVLADDEAKLQYLLAWRTKLGSY